MSFLSDLQGKQLFLVGIKGTGMATLACQLVRFGVNVTGSDVPEVFATEAVLKAANITWFETFSAEVMPADCTMLIHSAAYTSANLQVSRAIQNKILVFSYPQFVAHLSRTLPSFGIAGTHGKSTACGSLDWILRKTGVSYLSLYGTHIQGELVPANPIGEDFSILEACEYRDHFLLYDLQGVLVTTVEHDHPDWFKDEEQTLQSFKRLLLQLPFSSFAVCPTDSSMSRQLIEWIGFERPDLTVITYGQHASSMLRLTEYTGGLQESSYRLEPLHGHFHTQLASIPLCLDGVGAAILGSCILLRCKSGSFDVQSLLADPILAALLNENSSFPGCAGRVEVLFEAEGVVYVQDYAHHPREIEVSLASLRERFPWRRVVVVFFPHTASRTMAFFDEFVTALSLADKAVIRPIATSARHDGDSNCALALGQQLAQATGALFCEAEEVLISSLGDLLHPGDLCVTMGAGNTHGVAMRIASHRRSESC